MLGRDYNFECSCPGRKETVVNFTNISNIERRHVIAYFAFLCIKLVACFLIFNT